MIWLLWLLLAVLAALLILLPLRNQNKPAEDALAFYRDQLQQLERDQASIPEGDYRETRLELERRLLAEGRKHKQKRAGGIKDTNKLIPWVACAATLAGSALLYMALGAPFVPEAPAGSTDQRLEQPVVAGGPTLGEALKQVRQRLAESPEDIEGWRILATTTWAINKYGESAQAYSRLVALQPDVINWRIRQLEAMMAMHHGDIVPAGLLVLDGILRRVPDHPAGQYYRGLSFRQAGDNEKALQVWTALRDRSTPGAPWLEGVEKAINDLAGPAPVSRADIGNKAADVAAMSEEEQAAFIAGMVARLEARLDENPDDADGWLMLARTRFQQGDAKAAKAALVRGMSQVRDQDRDKLASALDKLASGAQF